MVCFYPAFFMPSTYTDRNRPCMWWTNRHSQVGALSPPFPSGTFSKKSFSKQSSKQSSKGVSVQIPFQRDHYDYDYDSSEWGLHTCQPCPTDSDGRSWPQQKESVNAVKSLPRKGVWSVPVKRQVVLTLGNDKIRQALCCHEFMSSWILEFLKPTHTDLTEAALLWSFLRFTRRLTARKEVPSSLTSQSPSLGISSTGFSVTLPR